MKAEKLFTTYGKYSDVVTYRYRGRTYDVEYSKCWTYGNGGSPTRQHREAQARQKGQDMYKGYDIEFNFYGQKEYSVQYCGDDVIFSTEEEAKQFIDEITA